MKLTDELIEKAKSAKSVEEMLALASENKFEMTEEQAEEYFQKLNPKAGQLEDDELDNVVGGACGPKPLSCRHCGSTDVVLDWSNTEGDRKTCYYWCLNPDCRRRFVTEHRVK